MPYKIYTYADPYRISETDFWDGKVDKIKYYPQLCASRTLVNGLLSVMREDIVSLLCPLDDIVKERVFGEWDKNIGRQIQQFSTLTRLYSYWKKEKNLKDEYFLSLTHNKEQMLEALRLFIELGVKSSALDAQKLNLEHRLFAYLLKSVENQDLFKLPQMPQKSDIKKIFIEQAEKEKNDKEELYEDKEKGALYNRDIEVIERMIANTQTWDGNHVVIHGIHQFTPLQLRFIDYLDKMGVEIIFLYNYLPEFKEIYSSWSYIYQHFNAPIHSDENIKTYSPIGLIQRPGNAIATNMALLSEEGVTSVDAKMRKNYDLYKEDKVYEFDNVSEYAGYISDHFASAEALLKEREEESGLSGTPYKAKPGTSAVLSKMDEVVYTTNKDVDELLQVYHPEYARNRHFLAYPIGQFFSALYALWNPERKEIAIDYALIRECLNSGILTHYKPEILLKTLMNVEPVFANINNFTEFCDLYGGKYRSSYNQVVFSKQGSIAFPLKMLNIYNTYKVRKEDMDHLYDAICQINEIAKGLFIDINGNQQFDFKQHFDRLREFVRTEQPLLANKEEQELIDQLLTKLDILQLNPNGTKGSFEDLRKGLYFFLKQKSETPSDWFVKNFEQIDGDILNSREQNTYGVKKLYHFACVSDKDMNCSVDELLPWPLSEMFIEKAYNPKELPFQVYYAALGEKSNFLRYELFYGLYFNYCDTKISFVKRYGDDTTDYYELLKLIGLEKEDGTSLVDTDELSMVTVVNSKKISNLPYHREKMAAVFLCPYKYLLDYVLNPQPIFSGRFLLEKYLENVMIENTWKSIEMKPTSVMKTRLSQIIAQEAQKIRCYYSFLRETEILDIQRRVENYILAKVIDDAQKNVRKYEPTHMTLRKTFGDAWFKEDMQDMPEKHPYEAFENLTEIQNGQKIYSTHKVPAVENKQLVQSTLDYINNKDNNLERVGSWCTFCPDKNICLEPYALSNEQ